MCPNYTTFRCANQPAILLPYISNISAVSFAFLFSFPMAICDTNYTALYASIIKTIKTANQSTICRPEY